MKHVTFVLLAACAALAISNCRVAAQSSDDISSLVTEELQPTWKATAGIVMFHRSKALAEALVVENGVGTELINVSDFDLGWAAGPDVELSRQFDNGWAFGVRYFSIDGWNATHGLNSPGNLRIPLISDDPADTFDTAYASYSSRLYSTELNVSRQVGERLRFLAGFRWVELHESIFAGADGTGLEGSLSYGTANHLYGFQAGVEATLFQRGAFQLDGALKAGVFRNQIGMDMYGTGTGLDMDESSTVARTSFLGEIDLTARYKINRHWSVYGGYEMMWIDGVALAGDVVAALARSSDTTLINGSPFYHGATTGLEFAW